MENTQKMPGITNELQSDQKRNRTISLAVKVTALIAISIVLVSFATNLIIYNLSYHSLQDEIKDKIKLLASISAATIDGDELATLRTREDEGNETYLRLQQQLQKIKNESMGKIRYIYTIAKSGEKYIYVLDAEPIGDLKNHSHVGDLFNTLEYPVAVVGFKEPAVEDSPAPDEEFGGITQSGYAPVRDQAGSIIGVLGVDIDVSVLLKDQTEIKRAGLIAFISALLLALLLGIIFSRYLTKPILTLTKVTEKVAKGDLGISVKLNRNDELGLLGESFNSMIRDLNAAEGSLKTYNLELEGKVIQRTAALTETNKEIKDILDNISQAIFTIDHGFRFNPQYSKFASSIFGHIPFEERNILDVFFPLEEHQTLRESMTNWLNRVFRDDGTGWDHLEELQPIGEIAIHPANSSYGDIKYIKIDFKPITTVSEPGSKETISKVMVIVQDITEEKSLQIEISAKEKEYKDNIDQIVEIIKMDQELFQDFITECKDNLVSFEPKLIQLRDDMENMDVVNDLTRIMHTIKGNARSFNLVRIAGEAHGIENIFSSIRKGENTMTDSLLDEMFKRLDKFNLLFQETMDIFNKIILNKNPDFGKTRGEKRNKEDSEIIRVKVNEIDRLAELLSKADKLLLSNDPAILASLLGPEKAKEVEAVLKETDEKIKSIRKISFSRLFARFPRMIRDISIELSKKVRFVTTGENIIIDKYIYDNLTEPIIHILRNSLDHGVEKPEERVQLGKVEEGTIRFAISEKENELVIEISDDGKGLDYEKIRAKAVTQGLISAESALAMSEGNTLDLIFLPGFSTNDYVTNISGRGVGMFAVKTAVENNLKGRIKIETTKNKGTMITLNIPTEK